MARIDWNRLFAAAQEARTHAHAPYSSFHVGAAILCADGRIVVGCNVENVTFGLTVCAERNAVAQLVLARGTPRAVAIVTGASTPTPPCGACRQVLAEFAGPTLPVRSATLQGARVSSTLGRLLPQAFTPADLRPAARRRR